MPLTEEPLAPFGPGGPCGERQGISGGAAPSPQAWAVTRTPTAPPHLGPPSRPVGPPRSLSLRLLHGEAGGGALTHTEAGGPVGPSPAPHLPRQGNRSSGSWSEKQQGRGGPGGPDVGPPAPPDSLPRSQWQRSWVHLGPRGPRPRWGSEADWFGREAIHGSGTCPGSSSCRGRPQAGAWKPGPHLLVSGPGWPCLCRRRGPGGTGRCPHCPQNAHRGLSTCPKKPGERGLPPSPAPESEPSDHFLVSIARAHIRDNEQRNPGGPQTPPWGPTASPWPLPPRSHVPLQIHTGRPGGPGGPIGPEGPVIP